MTKYSEALSRLRAKISVGRRSTDPREVHQADHLDDLVRVAIGETNEPTDAEIAQMVADKKKRDDEAAASKAQAEKDAALAEAGKAIVEPVKQPEQWTPPN